MAMSIASIWALFRLVRVLVFSLSTLLSMGYTVIYSVLLWRGWNLYSTDQRAVVICLLSIYALSSITFYLMLIFRFRLWMDGLRVAALLFFQVGGTVTIALFVPSLPCTNLGSVSTCKTVENIVIFGGWSLTGLLLLFAFYLAAMSYVPVPQPRPNPEAILALSLATEKNDKRASLSSVGSASSLYSQTSYVSRLHVAPRNQNINIPLPSPSGPPRMPLNYYRSGSPGSLNSTSTTTRSNFRASTREKYQNSQGLSAPRPRIPQQAQLPMMVNEPFSRQGTPMSTTSRTSYASQPKNTSLLYPPPGLESVGSGLNFPQPPGHVPSTAVSAGRFLRATSPFAGTVKPTSTISGGPAPPVAAQMGEALVSRTPSPVRSLNSELDSLKSTLNRNGSASSVPRSPSPDSQFFHNSPATPLSAVLPAHPVLPLSPFSEKSEGEQFRDGKPIYRLYDRPVVVKAEQSFGSAARY